MIYYLQTGHRHTIYALILLVYSIDAFTNTRSLNHTFRVCEGLGMAFENCNRHYFSVASCGGRISSKTESKIFINYIGVGRVEL